MISAESVRMVSITSKPVASLWVIFKQCFPLLRTGKIKGVGINPK